MSRAPLYARVTRRRSLTTLSHTPESPDAPTPSRRAHPWPGRLVILPRHDDGPPDDLATDLRAAVVIRAASRFTADRLGLYALAEPPTYRAVHARIRRERGPANARACAMCGRRAAVWACTSGCSDLTGTNARGAVVHYSADPSAYEPACRRCARRADVDEGRARRGLPPLPPLTDPLARSKPEPTSEPVPLFAFDAAPEPRRYWASPARRREHPDAQPNRTPTNSERSPK